MNKYIPFLKIKQNEVFALKTLPDALKKTVVPFFDFPRKSDMTNDSFAVMVNKAVRSVDKNLSGFNALYLDNFDIEDKITVNGVDNYQFIIESFLGVNFIPVVGLDRTITRNQLVFDSKAAGLITSDVVALRLQKDDFEDFALAKEAIQALFDANKRFFSNWILILDNGLCSAVEPTGRSLEIKIFIDACCSTHKFNQVVITGSSIPASVSEILSTDSQLELERVELLIYKGVSDLLGNDKFLTLGDYTIVSPLYSDLTIPPEMMQNVTAPKVIYSSGMMQLFLRGAALKTHPNGNGQYNDMIKHLVSLPLFRGKNYSFGDEFLHQKQVAGGTSVTPSNILKPTINAHMTYMCLDYPN